MDQIQHAAQDQFQKQSHRYARGHILENTQDVAAALESIALPAGAEALDVATGAGHTAFALSRAGFRVTASDLTPAMLERVREGAAERGLDIRTRQHSAEALPYPDATFDLVSCRVAPHHFSSPADFVRESARVLKPGGWFLVIDGTVPDDDAEAGEWLHHVEKLRDPSHNRLLLPANGAPSASKAGSPSKPSRSPSANSRTSNGTSRPPPPRPRIASRSAP
ncbi:MAG: class I SAM-dependent methyltransferase [Chthoniobacteraceae bacterium]|jgi:ubiquinone/menaquinone biosynthesis C-methylase UbiE